MTERFTKQQFEDTLPKSKKDGSQLWEHSGFVDGEFCYRIPVSDHVFITIRSSVKIDGYAAETGGDSIRCWLTDEVGLPLGNKIQKYVTRVPGWQERLTNMLRALYSLGRAASKPCPKCGCRVKVFKVTNDGPNHGRMFLKCSVACGYFEWL